MINQLKYDLNQEKDQNKQYNMKQFMTEEQDEVWLTLHIAHNFINRDELKSIVKIAEE